MSNATITQDMAELRARLADAEARAEAYEARYDAITGDPIYRETTLVWAAQAEARAAAEAEAKAHHAHMREVFATSYAMETRGGQLLSLEEVCVIWIQNFSPRVAMFVDAEGKASESVKYDSLAYREGREAKGIIAKALPGVKFGAENLAPLIAKYAR